MNDFSFPPRPWVVGRFFRSLKRRIYATLALLVGGFCWVVLYLAFLAGHFAWYQNLAIILVSVIVIPAAVVAIWIQWGFSVGRRIGRTFWDHDYP